MGCGFNDVAATTRSGPWSAFTKRPGEPKAAIGEHVKAATEGLVHW
jgi:hypothetical protein